MNASLFTPTHLGALALPSRIAMAPMTRSRTTQPGNVPNALMAEYYGQRASAALIVTEATQISPQGQGYSFTPGIHSEAQVEGWRLVTDAVHRNSGRIVLQLWHVGRMSHASFHSDGVPVAPSALTPNARVWIVDPATGVGGMQDCPLPRALEPHEIGGIVEDFRKAAANAMRAGFDGVEIHGANGYLIDQFLRRSSNLRTDAYGGAQENRIRFLVEVSEAVAAQVGADRTGIRMSPFITQRNMSDSEMIPTMLKAAAALDRIGLAYIHLAEADWDDAPSVPDDFRRDLRAAYSGGLIVAGKYNAERASAIVDAGLADVVAFGRPFIANPDFPRRVREGLPMADLVAEKLFGGGREGYADFPAAQA
jgi:N-ethylmaleimide reductase